MKTKTPTIEKLTKSGYYYVNADITAANFPIPETVETENYKIIKMDKSFSSKEAIERIKTEGCRPGNIYELALLKENHPELWPKGQWSSIIAFGTDFTDSGGNHRVPYVFAFSGGGFEFGLGHFEETWNAGFCLLCFCDNQSSETLAPIKELEPFGTFANAEEKQHHCIEYLKLFGYKITKEF